MYSNIVIWVPAWGQECEVRHVHNTTENVALPNDQTNTCQGTEFNKGQRNIQHEIVPPKAEPGL